MSFSSYEQEFVINDQIISGVTSVGINYGADVEPLYLAGIGYVDSFISGPVEGELSITRYMIGPDILSDKRDDQDLTGGFVLGEGVNEVGFTRGRILSRSVACNIGEIPTIENTIRIYGNFGNGIPAITGSYPGYSSNYEAIKVNQEDREYIIPTQGSISVSIGGDDEIDILGFNVGRTINVEALYALNKEHVDSLKNYEAHDMQIIYPIETKLDFTISQENYNILQMRELMDYDSVEDLNGDLGSIADIDINIYDPQDSSVLINSYHVTRAKVSSVAQNSATDTETTVTATFVGYETDPRTPDVYPNSTPTPAFGTDQTAVFLTAQEQADSDEGIFGAT